MLLWNNAQISIDGALNQVTIAQSFNVIGSGDFPGGNQSTVNVMGNGNLVNVAQSQ